MAVWEIRKVYGIDCEKGSETRPVITRSRIDYKDIFGHLYKLFLYYEEMERRYPDVFYIVPIYGKNKGYLLELVVVYKNNNGGHDRYKRYYIVKHIYD